MGKQMHLQRLQQKHLLVIFFFGEKATIAYKDEVSGPLTVNVGRLSYTKRMVAI